jgi:biotin operon repressor
MANKLKQIYKLKETFRLLSARYSQRQISAMLSISRNTVKSYINLANAIGIDFGAAWQNGYH